MDFMDSVDDVDDVDGTKPGMLSMPAGDHRAQGRACLSLPSKPSVIQSRKNG